MANSNIINFPQYDKNSYGFANYHAQEELNDFINFWELAEKQFERTILFKEIDAPGIKQQILKVVFERYFDKEHMLKQKFIEDFKKKYGKE